MIPVTLPDELLVPSSLSKHSVISTRPCISACLNSPLIRSQEKPGCWASTLENAARKDWADAMSRCSNCQVQNTDRTILMVVCAIIQYTTPHWSYCFEWELRAVPEIILGGGRAHFFFRPLHPQDTHGVRAPQPPGHISALINLPHYGSNTPWPPGQVTSPPPTPRTHCQQNTLHPQDKVFVPPEDNFWNSPYVLLPDSSQS